MSKKPTTAYVQRKTGSVVRLGAILSFGERMRECVVQGAEQMAVLFKDANPPTRQRQQPQISKPPDPTTIWPPNDGSLLAPRNKLPSPLPEGTKEG